MTLSVSLGQVAVILTILVAVVHVQRNLVGPLVRYMRRWNQEHDLIWEDYSIRHGLPFRSKIGKNAIRIEADLEESREEP